MLILLSMIRGAGNNNHTGISIPTIIPAIISVGRCTAVITLALHIMRLKMIPILPNRMYLLSLCRNHRRIEAIAILIDTPAWSDGKLLFGRYLSKMVLCFSSANPNIMFGLSF